MDSIVVCAVFQDAAQHILEWLAFHRMIGVDRFVLYDQSRTDDTTAVIARSRFARQALVLPHPHGGDRSAAYADFVAHHAGGFTWAAVIETGDFLHPLAADLLRSLLPSYDGFSTVLLRRLLFVVSGNHRPGHLVIAGHTARAPDVSPQNTVAATLLRVSDIRGVSGSPPAFTMAGAVCDGSGNRAAATEQVSDGALVLNCYRRLAERHETVPDRRIVRFLPRLRALLHDVSVAATPVAIPIPAPPPRQAAAPAAPAPSVAAPRVVPPAPRAAVTLPLSPSDGAPVVPPDAPGPSAVAPSPAAAASQPAAAGTWQRTPALLSQAASVAPSPPPAAVAIPIPAPAKVPAVAAASVPASLRLGIGITTYNRESVLAQTLDRVQRHTTHLDTIVAVVDDGSTDGTLDMLRARQVLAVTGRNTGVAWNKNRALFLLLELQRCDVVILLEDDAYPNRDGWQNEWIGAALRWGHVNVAADWLREHFISGTGTLEDPIVSQRLTAQCAVFSREAIMFGGYFDTRFRGYGHEHVEHSWRLMRMGYGGSNWTPELKQAPQFKLIWGGVIHHFTPSANEGAEWQTERNRVLAQLLLGEYSYRAPYQNEEEARRMRDEMRHSFPRAVL